MHAKNEVPRKHVRRTEIIKLTCMRKNEVPRKHVRKTEIAKSTCMRKKKYQESMLGEQKSPN